MSAAPITLTPCTSGSFAFAGGGWAGLTTNASCLSGKYNQSVSNGDTVTFTTPTCTSIYLVPVMDIGSVAVPRQFSVTIDGTLLPDFFSMATHVDNGVNVYAGMIPIARNLTQGVHTVKLTNLASILKIDSFVTVNAPNQAAKGTPIAGSMLSMGSSLGASGYNLNCVDHTYHYIAAERLRVVTGQSITLHNRCATGTAIAQAGGAISVFINNVGTDQPQYILINMGTNDLFNGNGNHYGFGTFVRQVEALVCLMEDSLDLTQCTVVIATPVWSAAPTANLTQLMNSGTVSVMSTSNHDNHELAVLELVAMMQAHPQVRVVDLYGAMLNRHALFFPSYVYPPDYTHPNDSGDYLMGLRFANALLGNNEDAFAAQPVNYAGALL